MKILSNFKGRIVAAAVILLIVSMTILSTLAYRQLSEVVTYNVDEHSMLELSNAAEKVGNLMEGISQEISLSSHHFTSLQDEVEIMSFLRQIQTLSDATAIVVGFEDGLAYNSNKGKYDSQSYDPRVRSWYKSAKNKRKTIITDVYTGKATGTLMISIATPFYNGSQLNGVLLADVELRVFGELTASSISSDENITLFDGAGLVIASTNKTAEVGKSRLSNVPALADLERAIFTKEKGVLELEFSGQEKVFYFTEINLDESTKWHLVIGLNKSQAYKVLDDSLRLCCVIRWN